MASGAGLANAVAASAATGTIENFILNVCRLAECVSFVEEGCLDVG